MLSAGEEEVVNEGKLWKGGFNFKYSMYGARQACYFTKKIFLSAHGSSGIPGFRNVVVLLMSGCMALDNGHA